MRKAPCSEEGTGQCTGKLPRRGRACATAQREQRCINLARSCPLVTVACLPGFCLRGNPVVPLGPLHQSGSCHAGIPPMLPTADASRGRWQWQQVRPLRALAAVHAKTRAKRTHHHHRLLLWTLNVPCRRFARQRAPCITITRPSKPQTPVAPVSPHAAVLSNIHASVGQAALPMALSFFPFPPHLGFPTSPILLFPMLLIRPKDIIITTLRCLHTSSPLLPTFNSFVTPTNQRSWL